MPLESNSAASVSPALVFELKNGTFTFNFQMDGRVTAIGFQEGRAVTGTLSEGQAAELRDAIGEHVHSPALVFELENGSTFTFDFQMDGRVAVNGSQEGRAVTGTLSEEQAGELRDAIGEYIHKRNG